MATSDTEEWLRAWTDKAIEDQARVINTKLAKSWVDIWQRGSEDPRLRYLHERRARGQLTFEETIEWQAYCHMISWGLGWAINGESDQEPDVTTKAPHPSQDPMTNLINAFNDLSITATATKTTSKRKRDSDDVHVAVSKEAHLDPVPAAMGTATSAAAGTATNTTTNTAPDTAATRKRRRDEDETAVMKKLRLMPKKIQLNPNASFLLQLPAELRNNIYEYVLLEPGRRIELRGAKIDDIAIAAESVQFGDTELEHSNNSLLQVCQQIREESSDLFYYGNTFHYTITTPWDWFGLYKWLRRIGPRASQIQKLELTFALLDRDSELLCFAADETTRAGRMPQGRERDDLINYNVSGIIADVFIRIDKIQSRLVPALRKTDLPLTSIISLTGSSETAVKPPSIVSDLDDYLEDLVADFWARNLARYLGRWDSSPYHPKIYLFPSQDKIREFIPEEGIEYSALLERFDQGPWYRRCLVKDLIKIASRPHPTKPGMVIIRDYLEF